MAGLKLVCGLMLCMLAVEPMVTTATITCEDVTNNTKPCIAFLQTKGKQADCCEGLRTLAEKASTTSDKEKYCNCGLDIARNTTGIKDEEYNELPEICHVNVPFRVHPDTNCSNVE